jgi:hypothetical protein
MAKAKKQRAKTYDKPLKIRGTFADVIKVSVSNPEKPKEKKKKNYKKDNP